MSRASAPSLRIFLEHPARPADTLTYHELQGFLFAVVSAPELVRPSEWLPLPNRVSKAGRNDPCPCGSGKKFKKCCGKTRH